MKLLLLAMLPLAAVALAAPPKPSIILVHGAFADASGWSKIIPILEHDGYYVTAVQIPLTSLADDVATTKRVLDAQKDPVVVVGHSYGGAVITGAAAGNKNVKSLVYVAAFAPDDNEPLGAAGSKFAAPPLNTVLVPDSAGFLYIDRAKFHEDFCKDLPESDARVMAATQKPLTSPSSKRLCPSQHGRPFRRGTSFRPTTAQSTRISNASTRNGRTRKRQRSRPATCHFSLTRMRSSKSSRRRRRPRRQETLQGADGAGEPSIKFEFLLNHKDEDGARRVSAAAELAGGTVVDLE